MGWAEDYLRKSQGQQDAQIAAGPIKPLGSGLDNPFGDFAGSAISSIGEMFGAQPTQEAQDYRMEHPWLGLGSELVGTAVPYGVVGRLSSTARGAALLDSAMAKTGIDAAARPILHSAVKEAIRYTPVEIGRLGIGAMVADDWDQYKNLLADVGLSYTITGGFGGIGGFFRSAGKDAAYMGRVVGADLAFAPTFEYRMSRAPGAQVHGDMPLEDVQNKLFREVFQEKPHDGALPGTRQSYVPFGLDGGNPETDALVDQLFRPSGESASKASLFRQPLMRRDGTWAIDEATQKQLLGGLGMDTMQDVAETVRFPRLVTVNSPSAAGTISKALDESAMQWVAPGVMIGKEKQGGLFVVAKRLKAGGDENSALRADLGRQMADIEATLADPVASKGKLTSLKSAQRKIYAQIKNLDESTQKIGAGDQWFIGKTDRPDKFAPRAMTFAKQTVTQWAKYREAWQPTQLDDLFNRNNDLMLKSFSPADFQDIAARRLSRGSAISNISKRVSEKLKEFVPGLEGVADSTMARNLAEQFYDIMAPTVVNEGRNALYARLFGLLRNGQRVAKERVNKLIGGEVKVTGTPLSRKNMTHDEGLFGIRPVQQIVNSLNDEELQTLKHISDAQAPMEKLAEFTKDGIVSPNLRLAVEDLQKLNREVWAEDLAPAFKNAELDQKFDLLEGYIMPRIFKGDWFVPVRDEGGRTVFLASGTMGTAKKEAQAIIDEGGRVGTKLEMGKPELRGQGKNADAANDIHELVQMQMGKSAEMQEIIQNAMKRIAIERAQARRGSVIPNLRPGKTLTEARTGQRGTPDTEVVTKADVIKSIQSHYQQLYNFAGYSNWKRRWMPEAANLEKQNPTLAADLGRKANQIMGYEGKITNTLNKALTPILGPAMGGKAATRIAQGTNELMYNWNLAIANPTFALLNVLTPLQTTLPHIAFLMRAGDDVIERDMHMILRHGSDGKPREVAGILDAPKVMMQSWKEMGAPDADLLEAYGRAKTDGTLLAQLFEGFVGGQSRAHETLRDAFKNAGGGVAGGWEFIKRTATFLAERSEEWSRIQAFTSYYVLGRDYFKLNGDQLYRFAQRGTHNSMFGYSVIDRSRMFTGPIGSMFGLFKNWQMHFINSMAQYAGLAIKDGIYAPMLWQFGVAGAIGGLGALGPLKWVADGLASWNDESQTSYLWLQNNFEQSADELYFGLPALFGATLQASSTLPGTDVRNDLTSLSSFVFLERAKKAGMAVGDAWDYAQVNGKDPLQDANIRDKMLNAFMPRALFRAFASAEGDYIKSMSTGYPQIRGVSPTSKFLYGMGLNQVEIERHQIAAKELWKDQELRRTRTQQLGIALAEAQLNGDWDSMEAINKQAIMYGIEPTKVYKSAMTRLKRENTGDILSRYDAERAGRYYEAVKDR